MGIGGELASEMQKNDRGISIERTRKIDKKQSEIYLIGKMLGRNIAKKIYRTFSIRSLGAYKFRRPSKGDFY